MTYNDPRRFGFMLLLAAKEILAHPLFAKLGMEPLDPAMSADTLARILQGRATPLKSALLDQKNIAGLGNIYVCEALHRARLSPLRIAGSLAASGKPPNALERLSTSIKAVLTEAIEAEAPRCATTDRRMGLSVTSNIIFASTTARMRPVQRAAARVSSRA